MEMQMGLTIEAVRLAAERIEGAVVRTPFVHSQTLSQLTGAEVWLKFENLQFTASFKERGALNRLLQLSGDERVRGVVAVSAGNHAQGVAYHGRRLGIPVTVVMPNGTPRTKITRTEGFGAKVVLKGANFAEASLAVPNFVDAGLTFLSPFNDLGVMAGQGTIALEMIEQGPVLDAMIVPVGGGGLIGGIGTVLAAAAPQTELIGVESEFYPSMASALAEAPFAIPGGTSVAEGIAVAWPGDLTLAAARATVADMIIVRESAIEDAVALLLQIEKTLCEGAGAAGLAALMAQPERFRGRRVGLILCGGNIDTRVLIAVLQRHLARAGQLVRLRVIALDNAGPLGGIATIIAENGGNILDVNHDRVFAGATARAVCIDFSLELTDPAQALVIVAALAQHGFPAELIDLAR
jgi:threonine dehydratase